MKRISTTQLDFKDRRRHIDFGDKKRGKSTMKLAAIGIVACIAVGAFWASQGPGDRTSVGAEPTPLIETTPNAAPQATSTETDSGEKLVPLKIPDNAPMPNGLAIPEQTKDLSLAPNTIDADAANEPEALPQESLAFKNHTLVVKSGDTLASLFKSIGSSAKEVYNLTNAQHGKKLVTLFPGDRLEVSLFDDGRVHQLSYRINERETLVISRNGDSLFSDIAVDHLEVRVKYAHGTISTSLYEDAKKAGLTDNLIMGLANIFGWDIDFALDLREGDQFSMTYEEIYRDGEHVRDGAILAASFTNQNKPFTAVRYEASKGDADYYSPDGLSMRKAFLRSPVDFRRISSRFTHRRCHPVIGVCRPHRGVDYAASTGTPIRASGDGKITYRGTKGGYGRTVVLQHGNTYQTLYAHLSNYRKGQRNGSRVKQGDVIGYVGKSGLATGPHLHYEFRVNGVHRNPLTVALPDAAPIQAKLKDDFLKKTAPLIAQLNTFNHAVLALNEAKTDELH